MESRVNFGAIYENFVAQELKAHGFEPSYYNSAKFGELDFVVEYKTKVLPIEVKSGKHYERHRALTHIMEVAEYGLDEAWFLRTVPSIERDCCGMSPFVW